MAKTILGADLALLLCVSVLAGSWLGLGATPPAELGWALGAVVLAAVMAVTEMFSGLRWPALIALAATVVGLVAVLSGMVTRGWGWAWVVAWVAVAGWFALLAAAERSDR
ncbi:hypothetical protein [Mycolicibacterium thermoresistibile]|uniref:Uncharacterized protein n=2 Tax=Mycolicibacterium thermoresistibile TaxID=1797 RepID=G7CHU5_MYCT3|nr:hypothetical protein [Mycolicibacterium thermoresistibile]EHI12405.1 hypothetical protein KEK_15938 [Mycolicibacterium thermoresistibile ATCC 19527]MCV7190887.1 hypothetical protein [Mycolicibacterium thermoresistibile]GAT15775.1 putative uncharacterized protein [Mycolicibacterium thermoresistibile]SNW16680.1 Uncharacterised protein [Mycolicibacterium thermoresistibile]